MAFEFDDARVLDQFCYDLIWADFPRATNRTLIDRLANGVKPYTDEEAEENKIKINVNDLTMPRVLHDARSQFASGFLTSDKYFSCKTDWGASHKRDIYGGIVTKEINKILKGSVSYYESLRSKFANLVLHGIAPAVWNTMENPIPKPLGVEDILIPGGTELGFDNLPMFVVRRSFTGIELKKITQSKRRDPGWNMEFVERCIRWLDSEMIQLSQQNQPENFSPEKWEEMAKESGDGMIYTDRCPTLDAFDIYGYVEGDEKNSAGWVRRIILDSWSQPAVDGKRFSIDRRASMKDDFKDPDRDDFLYSSGMKPIGDSWQNIASFQFGDLSATAPFKYHSVRSLGWLIYAPCHLQNRMICKFNEAVFEGLLQYFKVSNPDDMQRAMKLELANMGVLDDTIKPVPAAERWTPNVQLTELGLGGLKQQIQQGSTIFSSNISDPANRTEKTKFEIMAKVQQSNALVASAINQAHQYQYFEYVEIVRRFMLKDSRDPKTMAFRAACLRKGVPEKMLVPECWETISERMMGNGNQTLSMLQAQQMMEWRPAFDPEPQRVILREAVQAVTGDPYKALQLVPETPAKGTPAQHDAALTCGALMQGIPVDIQTGINHIEYIEAALKILASKIMASKKQGNMASGKDIQGFQAIAQNIAAHIKILAQDKTEQQRVKKYSDILGKLVNEIKGFQQRLQQAMQAQQKQQGGKGNPADAAKAQGLIVQAQTKAQIKKAEAAQKLQQNQQKFQQQMQHNALGKRVEIASRDLETAANIRRNKLSSMDEHETG